jgi:hypothetical protein
MSQKIIGNRRVVGSKKGRGTLIVLALVLLTIIAANNLAVNDVSAATSPTLGTASTFAVFAATEVTDASPPASAIKGDVGLRAAGSNYAGITSGEVTGTIYSVDASGPAGRVTNPTLINSAYNDIVSAYGALASQSCDHTFPTGTQSLNGLNLVAGVYCADAFTLSGTLTLSGPTSGVWIFKSSADLITSGAANVVGGDPCNVWWWLASSATLGTNTELTGNILALTAITLAHGAILNGRALVQTAAVTLDATTVNITCAIASTVTSPITTSISTVISSTFITTIGGTLTTITSPVTTTIGTVLTTVSTKIIIIPEYPWGVLLLLILILPIYMVLKRRTSVSIRVHLSRQLVRIELVWR